MIRDLTFDLGKKLFSRSGGMDLVVDKSPVSISLAWVSTLLIYVISIPWHRHGARRPRFDVLEQRR